MRALLILSAAIPAACAPERPAELEPPADRVVAAARQSPPPLPPGQLPDPPPPGPRPGAPGGLLPLSEAEVRAGLGSGASCALQDGDRLLMAATPGDSIVKERGAIVHLKPEAKDWNALAKGGRFVGKGLIVEVDAGAVVSGADGLVERNTSLTIKRGRRGFGMSHGPQWLCGS